MVMCDVGSKAMTSQTLNPIGVCLLFAALAGCSQQQSPRPRATQLSQTEVENMFLDAAQLEGATIVTNRQTANGFTASLTVERRSDALRVMQTAEQLVSNSNWRVAVPIADPLDEKLFLLDFRRTDE